MATYNDRRFQNETIALDGNAFNRCRFEDCSIVYAGGDYSLNECTFGVVVWEFEGPANNTVLLMKVCGIHLDQLLPDI